MKSIRAILMTLAVMAWAGSVMATVGPPEIVCPAPAVVECGTSAVVTAQVSSPVGDPLTVVWTLNGSPVQTNHVPATAPNTVTHVSLEGGFPLGTNSVAVSATNPFGGAASCSTTVTVVDTTPPAITNLTASPNVLWPPDHRMVPVTVQAAVVDTCGATTWKIIAVTSNQPVLGPGSGNTAPDWQITGDTTILLRAERAGNDARIYTITVQATDEAGNLSTPEAVLVTVVR